MSENNRKSSEFLFELTKDDKKVLCLKGNKDSFVLETDIKLKDFDLRMRLDSNAESMKNLITYLKDNKNRMSLEQKEKALDIIEESIKKDPKLIDLVVVDESNKDNLDD